MTDPAGLVEKHLSNGLLIDTNLFLLLLIGATNQRRIEKFSRTDKFSVADYRLLAYVVGQFKTVLTTPHVLTEVSNLAKLGNPELTTLRGRFRDIVERTEEIYEASRTVMAEPTFAALGLTDAAITLAAKRPMLVLTDDLELYRVLFRHGVDVINFNHLRSQQYLN